ncbi:hypothetical protein JNUCC1_02756 [Lentibacillus sp. JNUCC-1]|nr:hypothetical protein [Lentibacillus sp. JNUCC-1]
MSLPPKQDASLEDFYKMREETNQILEFAGGVVLMSPSPSTRHQQVSARL